jgi:microcystin-dependent protein
MSDYFLGEIRIVPFNFAPNGWAFCNGQILPISQNTALFSLLGTYYGGNGTSNFGLPNLQGSVAVDYGSGANLTSRSLGETGGEQAVTITSSTMPSHVHTIEGSSANAGHTSPSGNLFAKPPTPPRQPTIDAYKAGALTTPVTLTNFISPGMGGSQPHNNLQPYLKLTYIIALTGIYPSRA